MPGKHCLTYLEALLIKAVLFVDPLYRSHWFHAPRLERSCELTL